MKKISWSQPNTATVWSPPPSPGLLHLRASPSSTASRAGTVTLSAARAGSGGSGGDDLPSSSTRQQQQEHEDTADTPPVLTWLAYALWLLNIIVMVVYSILLCELRANCPKIKFHGLFRLKIILYEL